MAPSGLILAGFMGSGKTSVGRSLAELLGWDFVDLDDEIASAAGRSIAEIFASEGEAEFRERETRAIAAVASRIRPPGEIAGAGIDLGGSRASGGGVIVATGGGAVVPAANRAALHRIGPIVCLDTPAALLWDRACRSDRPLAQDRLAFMALLDRRKAVYQELAYHVMNLDAGPGGPRMVAREIARRFVARPTSVRVPLGDRAYDVQVEPGGLSTLGDRMAEVLRPGRCLVLSHPLVWRRHGEAAMASLQAAGWHPIEALVPAGEGSKSLTRAQKLYTLLAENRIERSSPVVALGGGVVGDLGGFVAATYLRGLPFVQVPTTLLAQIDSSVGGKVAVNLAAGKNLVGAFHQPALVIADPLILHTLPEREFRAGLGELIKYGIILDADFFATIEQSLDAVLSREAAVLVPLIARACALKAEVVGQDERESGLRRILNFGHTVGHAVEKVAGYGRILHGEAVAIGMVAAGELGERAGTCPSGTAQRIAALLARAGLPVSTDLPIPALLEAMQHDKKVSAGSVAWVLPEGVGSVTIRSDIPQREVEEALRSGASRLRV